MGCHVWLFVVINCFWLVEVAGIEPASITRVMSNPYTPLVIVVVIFQLQQQSKVVDSLLNVLCPVLFPMPADILDYVALAKIQLVALDKLNGLNFKRLVMASRNLMI